MATLASDALALIYPRQCLSCDALVEIDHGLCGSCWGETPFISGAICDHCGMPLIGGEAEERAICDDCLAQPRPWRKGRAALVYRGGGRRLALGLKHGGREDIARVAGAWMVQAGREILSEDSVIVPVPLHWTRLLRRRYNQSALLAQSVAREAGCDLALDALVRTRRTQSLDHLPASARFEVLAGSIAAHPKRGVLAGRPVVLVDDVMTSGATYAAATAAALRAGAARVDVLTLARTVRAH